MKEKLKRFISLFMIAIASAAVVFYIWFGYQIICAIPGSRMF